MRNVNRVAHARNQLLHALKKLWYGKRGEYIEYGTHKLRYVVGSRPVRLKYASSADVVARNDARQIQFYLDHVQPGQLVFDIGGHFGEYAVLLGSLVGATGRVVTFEPDVDASPTLRTNLALNGFGARVIIEEICVFDSTESRQFFTRHGNAQSSLARSGLGGAPTDQDVERYAVRTIRLDDYLLERGLRAPDFMKLDVEGAEINALRGAKTILRSSCVIVCELHPYAWEEFGTSFDELLRIVHDSGRSVSYLDESRQIADGPAYGAVLIS